MKVIITIFIFCIIFISCFNSHSKQTNNCDIYEIERYSSKDLINKIDTAFIIRETNNEIKIEKKFDTPCSVYITKTIDKSYIYRQLTSDVDSLFYNSKEDLRNKFNHKIESEDLFSNNLTLLSFSYFFPLNLIVFDTIKIDLNDVNISYFGTIEKGYQSRIIGSLYDNDNTIAYWSYIYAGNGIEKEILFNNTYFGENKIFKNKVRQIILNKLFSSIPTLPPPPANNYD